MAELELLQQGDHLELWNPTTVFRTVATAEVQACIESTAWWILPWLARCFADLSTLAGWRRWFAVVCLVASESRSACFPSLSLVGSSWPWVSAVTSVFGPDAILKHLGSLFSASPSILDSASWSTQVWSSCSPRQSAASISKTRHVWSPAIQVLLDSPGVSQCSTASTVPSVIWVWYSLSRFRFHGRRQPSSLWHSSLYRRMGHSYSWLNHSFCHLSSPADSWPVVNASLFMCQLLLEILESASSTSCFLDLRRSFDGMSNCSLKNCFITLGRRDFLAVGRICQCFPLYWKIEVRLEISAPVSSLSRFSIDWRLRTAHFLCSRHQGDLAFENWSWPAAASLPLLSPKVREYHFSALPLAFAISVCNHPKTSPWGSELAYQGSTIRWSLSCISWSSAASYCIWCTQASAPPRSDFCNQKLFQQPYCQKRA